MNRLRHTLRHHRWLVLAVTALTSFYAADGQLWAQTYQVERAAEERLAELARRLDVPPDRLRRRSEGALEALRSLLSDPADAKRRASLVRLEGILAAMEEEVAANPYRDRIDRVLAESAPRRTEAALATLARLSTIEGARMPRASRRALLRGIHTDLEAALALPAGDDLPSSAATRARAMERRLADLATRLRPILDDPDALADDQLGRTLGEIASAMDGEVRLRSRRGAPIDRPLPIEERRREAATEPAGPRAGRAPTPARTAAPATASASTKTGTIAPEVTALAAELGGAPARLWSYVHDRIAFDPKWGAVRGPVGALAEGEGTAWDQAWLLRDLLVAAGIDARIEWGEIEVPIDVLTNLLGVSNAFRAGDLMTTGGVPIVLQVAGGQVVSARMTHPWVLAHVDYVPNRGATAGVPDTWIRMDPSLARTTTTPGIAIHEQVPFELGSYLTSGTELSPRRAYEDALWTAIRADGVACETLEQLKPAASPVAEDFPYLPGTLRGEILSVAGESAEMPAAFQHRVRIEVRDGGSGVLMSHELPWPSVYGATVELAWAGATPDDEATIAGYGDLFDTPPHLVELVPVLRVDGNEVARGAAEGAAESAEVRVTLVEAGGFETVRVHDTLAGERHVLAIDFGTLPRSVVDRHQEALLAARAGGDAQAAERAELALLGTHYLQELGTDLDDLAGWKHHRLLHLGTEALVSQTATVGATVGGSPVAWHRSERTVDVAGMTLGLFHVEGDSSFRRETLELLGSQGSFLEGQVFPQVLERRGIAAVSALTESIRRGQAVTRVDGSNVSAVLAAADLGTDVEQAVQHAVSQGKIAWVAESRITVDDWTGTGYVLEDPQTGAAGYLISGGLGGGSETGAGVEALQDLLGSEPWLEGSLLGEIFALLLSYVGGGGGPSTQQSDPINLSTGNFWRVETDLVLQARGLPVIWSRTFNSRSTHEGSLGYGWTFSFGESLEEEPGGAVLFREADGTEHRFIPDASGGYVPPAGKYLGLNGEASGGWTLRAKGGVVSEFTAEGRLVALEEPNGNRITLSYDGSGNLASVTDAAGRVALTVTTDGTGRITRIDDLAGRSVLYGYTNGDLTSVTDTVGETWTYSYDTEHNLVGRSDPLGNTDTWAYDTLDRCYRHVDPTGATETFSYAERGRKGVITDRRGFEAYVEMDAAGRATLQVDPLGNASRSTWDAANNRTGTTDPRGGETVRTYDEEGNLLTETDPLGETTTYTYDPTYHQVLTTTDAAGHTVTNVYDAAGNLSETSQVVEGATLTESFTYDANGLLETRTDARSMTTTFTWDATKGSLATQTDAAGQVTTMTTDALGRVTVIEDQAGNEMAVSWDGKDRVESATDPFGNQSSIGYDAAGRQISRTTPQGTSTTTYDAAGRPITSTDALGNTTTTEYDAAGQPVATTDARGNRTTTLYDPTGRVLARVDPLGAMWSFGYCAEVGGGGCGAGCSGSGGGGSFCDLTDPLGNVTRQDFDALGRVASRTDPEGNTTTIGYDELGRRSSVTDALGRTTTYEYDALGRLTAVVEANAARTEYTYDAAGNVTGILDAEGRVWSRAYDALRRLESETDPLNHTTSYTYDSLGNLETRTNPDGTQITYEYEVRRLTAVVLPGGVRETFGYDLQGRRTAMANGEVSVSFVYDALNRVSQVTNHTLGQTITYGYDAAGNRTSMAGPQGTVEYLYDAKNRLVEQQDPVTGTYRLSYDAADRRTGFEYPNGVTTEYEYDDASQLTLLLTRDLQGNTLDGYRYTYSPVGNRETMRSLRDDVLHSYTYDAVDRLTGWQRGTDRFETYTYDGVGNRETLVDEVSTTTYTYDLANQLTRTVRALTGSGTTATTDLTWNPNGNLLTEQVQGGSLTSYSWDALNRLTSLDDPSGSHSYGYDPNGIRVRETNGSDTRQFLHAGEDIVATYQGSQLDSYYTHGPGVDEPWAQARPGETEPVSYLHRDGLGSTTAVSSPAGQLQGTTSYSAFGSVEDAAGTQGRFGYTSRELDPTGLMYYRARYYQPAVGRFNSPDPARSLFGMPGFLNQYQYANNSPTMNLDPSGAITVTSSGVRGALALIYFGIAYYQLLSLGQLWWEWTLRGSEFSQIYRRAVLFEAGFLIGIAMLYAKIGWVLLTGKLKLSEEVFRNSDNVYSLIMGYLKEIKTLILWAAVPAACIQWTFDGIQDERPSPARVAVCVLGIVGLIDVLGKRGLI